MEFKLNKVDTELRQRVKNATKEDRVHRKSNVKVNKDKKDEEQKKQNFESLLKENRENKEKKKKVYVTAVKTKSVEVESFIDEDSKNDLKSGTFLDTKR